MRNSHIISITFLSLLLLIQSVYAQQEVIVGWGTISKFLAFITGMPQGMFDTLPEFLFHFLVPLLLIWFICLGFMKQLRIFTRAPGWIEWFISFSMAALAIYPTGWFAWVVVKVAGLSGVYATVVFFIMFVIGVALYAIRWASPQWGTHHFLNDLRKEDKDIRNMMQTTREQYAHNAMTDSQYLLKMQQLQERLENNQEKRKTMTKEA